MRLTLLESNRNFFRSAEIAAVSILAHVGLAFLILTSTPGTFRLPTTERDVRVLFLLPPDRVDAPERQAEIPLPERPGSGLDQASELPAEGEGLRLAATASRARGRGERGGTKSDQPLGAAPFLSAKVYTALQGRSDGGTL